MISFRLLSSYAWSSTLPSRVACHDLLSSARRGPAHVDHIFSKSPASELDMNVHFGMFIRALRSWIIQRPITSFLILAYATTAALAFVPKALTEPGLLPGGATPHGFLENVVGSAVPAFIVTALVSGRAGVRDLARRSFKWRVTLRWYAISLLGPLLILLLAVTALYGLAPLRALAQNW